MTNLKGLGKRLKQSQIDFETKPMRTLTPRANHSNRRLPMSEFFESSESSEDLNEDMGSMEGDQDFDKSSGDEAIMFKSLEALSPRMGAS